MAKKAAAKPKPDTGDIEPGGDGELFETQNVSRTVKMRANKYRDTSVAKSQAGTDFNFARDGLLDAMADDDIMSVIIELGGVRKRIVRVSEDALKIETVKEDNGDG